MIQIPAVYSDAAGIFVRKALIFSLEKSDIVKRKCQCIQRSLDFKSAIQALSSAYPRHIRLQNSKTVSSPAFYSVGLCLLLVFCLIPFLLTLNTNTETSNSVPKKLRKPTMKRQSVFKLNAGLLEPGASFEIAGQYDLSEFERTTTKIPPIFVTFKNDAGTINGMHIIRDTYIDNGLLKVRKQIPAPTIEGDYKVLVTWNRIRIEAAGKLYVKAANNRTSYENRDLSPVF